MQQFETGLNSPANGVYLVQHRGRHSDRYCNTVNERLSHVNSVEELVIALNRIREELLEGKLSL